MAIESSTCSTSQRTQPKQERAQQTVSRIKSALLSIVAEQGYKAATTNLIAERAHVNIATLYYYFPNQDAIARAIYNDVVIELTVLMNGMFTSNNKQPIFAAIQDFIVQVTEYMSKEYFVLLRLSEHVAELRDDQQMFMLNQLGNTAATLFLLERFPHYSRSQIEYKLYFISNMSMGMIRQYVLDPHPDIDLYQFARELTKIVVDYFESPSVL